MAYKTKSYLQRKISAVPLQGSNDDIVERFYCTYSKKKYTTIVYYKYLDPVGIYLYCINLFKMDYQLTLLQSLTTNHCIINKYIVS